METLDKEMIDYDGNDTPERKELRKKLEVQKRKLKNFPFLAYLLAAVQGVPFIISFFNGEGFNLKISISVIYIVAGLIFYKNQIAAIVLMALTYLVENFIFGVSSYGYILVAFIMLMFGVMLKAAIEIPKIEEKINSQKDNEFNGIKK